MHYQELLYASVSVGCFEYPPFLAMPYGFLHSLWLGFLLYLFYLPNIFLVSEEGAPFRCDGVVRPSLSVLPVLPRAAAPG